MSQQINLFNPIFLKQKKYFSSAAMLRALAVLVIGCALVGAYAHYQVKNLTVAAAASSAQLASAQAQLAVVKVEYGPKPKSPGLETEVVKAEQEMQSLKQVFDVLGEGKLGNTDGYSVYLRAFARQTIEGLWLTGFNIVGAGNEIGLQGRTVRPELVPAYMNRLKREQIMQGTSFGTLEISQPAPAARSGAAAAGQAEAPQYIEFSLR